MEAIETSLIQIVSTIEDSKGHLQQSFNSTEISVQWCHGSPGAIPLLIEAAKIFP
jgi:hypothetical protein